jgi:hypothetical protein
VSRILFFQLFNINLNFHRYYRWPNGTFSLVPDGGLTVYYLSRTGDSGSQKSNPNFQSFPKGLRMVAGDPYRRTFNASDNSHLAISFVW